MIYSLESKFKGAFLCGLLAENLAINSNNAYSLNLQLFPSFNIAVEGLKNIVNNQGLNLNLWFEYLREKRTENLRSNQPINTSCMAIINLPFFLFYHENSAALNDNLEKTIKFWQDKNISTENISLWGYIIKVVLDNISYCKNIVDKTIKIMTKNQLFIPDILLKISNFIDQKTPFAQVSKYLAHNCNQNSRAIFQALYCFASIPNDFSACILRALKNDYQPKTTAILTGILWGLHNSFYNIPLTWRLSLKTSSLAIEINKLCEHLFALWTGNYNSSRINPHQACYSPYIVQAR